MNKVITIFGPTASGKTSTSIKLADYIISKKQLPAEIVNFDSLLFYKELNIGTAKPSMDERMGIEHHLIDIASAHSPINASDYVKLAEDKIEDLHKRSIIPILVGGSGFYLRALIKGMYQSAQQDQHIKDKVEILLQSGGISGIREFLRINDPKSLDQLHENDIYRNCRAVEFFLLTGNQISQARQEMEDKNPYDLSANCQHDWDCFHINLDITKEYHFPIILQRTREMLRQGLIDEVKGLLSTGFNGKEKPLQSIGYKETQDFLCNKITSQDELIERISIATRQLAKSQRTWFKKITPKQSYSPLDDFSIITESLSRYLN